MSLPLLFLTRMYHYTSLQGHKCQCEAEYMLLQQRAQSIIDSPEILLSGMLNDWGISKPVFPHFTYQMLADDNFMASKMDEMVVGGGA